MVGRYGRDAQPLERVAKHQKQRHRHVHAAGDHEVPVGHRHHLVRADADEEPDQAGAVQEDHEPQCESKPDGQHAGLEHADTDPLPLAAPVVLSDVRAHREADRDKWGHADLLDPDRRGERGHGIGAELVDPVLEHGRPHRDDGHLEPHRQPESARFSELGPADPPVGARQVQVRHAAHDQHEAPQHREPLRDHRGQRGAADAHPEPCDEQHDKCGVDHAGGDEEEKRCTAVTERSDHRAEEGERDGGGGPAEQDREERRRGPHQLGRRTHPGQQCPGAHRTDEGDDDGHAHTDDDARCHRPPHRRQVPGAERARDRDGDACRGAEREPEQQELQAPGRTDGCERVHPEQPSDDECVRDGVQLLEQVSQQERQGEPDDDADRRPDGQIPRDGRTFLREMDDGERGPTSGAIKAAGLATTLRLKRYRTPSAGAPSSSPLTTATAP